ncbi:MAG: flagellar motor switch protein FliN [Pirellulales bacterium]|nr:flagellar motor switch protein FliN [Pirellulales bacterium]
MTDNEGPLGQDEIDQAIQQEADGDSTPPVAPPPPNSAGSASMDQAKVEALLNASMLPTPTVPPKPTADSPSSQSDIDFLMDKTEQALTSINEASDLALQALPTGVRTFEFEQFGNTPANTSTATLEPMHDVQLDMTIELGRTHMELEEVLKLKQGAVVPLDKLASDPTDIYVNGQLVARGEVLVFNDNFCVRVAELIVDNGAAA